MTVLTAKAPAKINLYLHILGKREDGYHDLNSLVYFTEFGDDLTLDADKEFSFSIEGTFAHHISDRDNLVISSAQKISDYAQKPLIGAITLTKNIPVAAGLGGGSSDAATIIKLYERLWDLTVPEDLLLSLGADVPVCYQSKPCHMSGIGDVIADADENLFKASSVLLLNPNIPLSTKEVFEKFDKPYASKTKAETLDDVLLSTNSLTDTAIMMCPDIQAQLDFLNAQNGCLLARMAGSGPSVFGVFETSDDLEQAFKNADTHHKNWWAQKTLFI